MLIFKHELNNWKKNMKASPAPARSLSDAICQGDAAARSERASEAELGRWKEDERERRDEGRKEGSLTG